MKPSPILLSSLGFAAGLVFARWIPLSWGMGILVPGLVLGTVGVFRGKRWGWLVWVFLVGWAYGWPRLLQPSPPEAPGIWIQQGAFLVRGEKPEIRFPSPLRLVRVPEAPPGRVVRWVGRLRPVSPGSALLEGVAVDTLPLSGIRGRLLRTFYRRIHQQYPRKRDRAILEALLLAYRGDLPASMRDQFRRSGLMHLLALSGLHVGFWMGLGLLLARTVGFPFPWLFLAPLGMVWGMGWLVGFPPSFLRALWMLTFWVLALLRPRPLSPWDGWGAALLLSLVLTPHAVGDLGFQLSFLATAGILWVLPAFSENTGIISRWGIRPMAVTLAANLAVLPRLWMLQGGVSWVSPLINLAAVPLTGLILTEGVLGLLPYGSPFAYLSSRGLDLLGVLLRWSAGGWWAFPRPLKMWESLALYAFLGGLAFFWKRATRKVGN